MAEKYLFTSEAVSMGHPDKICDQISDAILDEFLKQDPDSKVAVECFITNNMLVIGGEAHSTANVDIIGTAKKVLNFIGYDGTNGFNPETAVFINTLHEQSSDIRQGVDRETEDEQGAGDQGIMFGYACTETPELMPAPIYLANETMAVYDTLRSKSSFKGERPTLKGLRPDAKCQYTIEYFEDGRPNKIKTILISMQHDEDIELSTLYEYAQDSIIPCVMARNPELKYLFREPYELLINPTGRFVIGGPEGDTGLTGRKIIVDTYGGRCPHGGGAFSGKDASKVDRSAAYAARYIAKNIVAAGIATEVTVQLSYAIGMAEPLSIYVNATNSKYSNKAIAEMIKEVFPTTPAAIIKKLKLKEPNFYVTSAYGHFGSECNTWEVTDKINDIKNYFKII